MTTRLGITIGDAAGIGPELVLRCWRSVRSRGPAVVYGRGRVLEAALEAVRPHAPELDWPQAVVVVPAPADADRLDPAVCAVVETGASDADEAVVGGYPFGQAVAAFGALQHAALTRAIDDAMAGEIDAVVTAPWHKARLLDAGLPPTGHTEVLAQRSGAERVVMVLAGDRLRVALVTAHVPLCEVADRLSAADIGETVAMFRRALAIDWGVREPNVAVCGLNPHAGEGGVIGGEELTLFPSLQERWRDEGGFVTGPWPADTLFPRVVAGRQPADGVVALYHDQGLIPLKTVHFGEAANITLGLPFVRTSVDHGTAYDIAGTLQADPGSFEYAAALGRSMAQKRKAAGAGPAA